jgi:hypothetical protein
VPRLRYVGLLAGALLATATPSSVSAQSASEIIDRMMSEYAERAAGIDNYTVVQETMGMTMSSYFVKEIVDGHPIFRMQGTTVAGMTTGGQSGTDLDDFYAMAEELKARASYEGRRPIDGTELHVLSMDDLEGLGFGETDTDEMDFKPVRGSIFLDVSTYAPRRFEMEGEMTNSEGVHEVTSVVSMDDYREIEGMLFPFRTTVAFEGLGAAIDEETRAQFEEMKRELENMPEAQRRMVESMMADRFPQFEAMMSGESTGMTIQMTVREVLVNSGPGDDR